jgi:hypothetical protein
MSRSLFAGTILALLLPAAGLAAYPDVPVSHRSAVAIHSLQAAEIMRGYPDGSFGPEVTLNRAELMKLLVESSVGAAEADGYGGCFPDVADEWYAPYVCYAAEQEWVSGYPDGTFQPGRSVNTAEALKMIVGSRGYAITPPDLAAGTAPFGTGAWFAPYVSTAIHEGIVDATAFRSVWPDAPLPRSRAAEFLYAVLLRADAIAPVLTAGSTCGDVNTSSLTLTYTAAGDTQLSGTSPDGASCQFSTQFNPYRTGTSGADELLSPVLLFDPRLTTKEGRMYSFPLNEDGRAYFYHAKFDPLVSADDKAVWEFHAGSGSLTRIPFQLSHPHLVSPDLRLIAFIQTVSDTVSRLLAVELATGKYAIISEAKSPETFVAIRGTGTGAVIGDFAFGTGNTITYGVHDSAKGKDLGEGAVEYAKIREQTVDISTLSFKQ